MGCVLPTTDPMKCRHCTIRIAGRPRGLCDRCYYDPLIREQYPPEPNPFTRHGVPERLSTPPLPDTPTDCEPGTPEKMAVLAARAEAQTELHHPQDRKRLVPPGTSWWRVVEDDTREVG